MKILFTFPVEAHHREIIAETIGDRDIFFQMASRVKPEHVENMDVIVGNVDPAILRYCKNLKLLQLNSAGTDGYTLPGVIPEGAMLANATGAYGVAISEHMVGSILHLMKKLDYYQKNMETREWKDHGPVQTIYGSRTLVVGLGDIGNEFAIRMHAMGSSVAGIRRKVVETPEHIEKMYSMDRLYEALSEADIVASCLPGSAETTKIFDREAFANMKQGAYFLNVGRGTAVDSDALYDALTSGHLGAAAIDVTDPEPLPSDHPLWSAPNLLITPHISGGFHAMETHDRIVKLACRNIQHLMRGEAIENRIAL